MALTEVIFRAPKLATIGVVQLDASVNEVHSKTNEVTDYPIDDDSIASDHIIRKPDEIEINGVVSNHPVALLASVNAASPIADDQSPVNERAELAYAELSRVMDAGELVEVVTTFKEYENMAITSLVVTRNARNGNTMDATIRMRQVRTAELETIEVPEPVVSSNRKPKDRGPKPTSNAPATRANGANQSLIFAGVSS